MWRLALAHLLLGELACAHTEKATRVRLTDEHGRDVIADAQIAHRREKRYHVQGSALKLSFNAHGKAFDYELMRYSVLTPDSVVSVHGHDRKGRHAEAHTFKSPAHDAVLSVVGPSFHGTVRAGQAMFDVEAHHGDGSLHVTRIVGLPGELGLITKNGTVLSRPASMVEELVAPDGSAQDGGRRLAFKPDDIDQWTDCFANEHAVRKFKFGAAIGSKLYKDKLGSNEVTASQWMQSMIAKANMVYEPQMHVVLELGYLKIIKEHNADAPDWDEGPDCPFTINDQLSKWSKWDQMVKDEQMKSMGVWHVFDDCFRSGTIGLAYVGVLCNGRSGSQNWNTGVNWYSASTWHTFAHEMGHNFGGGHSFELGQGQTGGIMDYGDGTLDGIYQFNTQFRKGEMCKEVNSVVQSCSAFSVYEPTCGNGLLEPGETCECEEWIAGATLAGHTSCTGCCNCQLEAGKQCVAGDGSGCCSAEGMFEPTTKMCHGLGGVKGYCSQGSCKTSHVCSSYPDYFGDFCGLHSNTDPNGQCKIKCNMNGKCDLLNGWKIGSSPLNHLPDGTPCGIGRTCKSGSCQTGLVGLEIEASEWLPPVPYSTETNISGCVGYKDRGFLGRPEWLNETGTTLEACNQRCLGEPLCHSFIFNKTGGFCELWSRQKTVDMLATTPGYDTYICDAYAAGVDFLDAEIFPNREVQVRPGAVQTGAGAIVPRMDVDGQRYTPSMCYKACITDPGCHVFVYGAISQTCVTWGSEVSETNLVFTNESEETTTYILPCHGRDQVCHCYEGARVRVGCQCGENTCGFDQYCYRDNSLGRCSNTPLDRRLGECKPITKTTTTTTPAPAPPPGEGGCSDSAPQGAVDPYKTGCDAYDTNPGWCGKYNDNDFSSDHMCCSCGGGSADGVCSDTAGNRKDPYNEGCDVYKANQGWCGKYNDADFSSEHMCCTCGGGSKSGPSPTPKPTAVPTAAPPSHAPTPLPPDETSSPTRPPTKAPTPAPTAAPTRAPTAAPTAAPTPMPTRDIEGCVDTDHGAKDKYNVGCDRYTQNPGWCNTANWANDADFSSGAMCCICGGGASSKPTNAPQPTLQPTPAPTSPPEVICVLTVSGVDFDILKQDVEATSALKEAMKGLIAEEAGVPKENVVVTFWKGSLKVRSVITVPTEMGAESIASTVKASSLDSDAVEKIQQTAAAVPSLQNAVTDTVTTTSEIEVNDGTCVDTNNGAKDAQLDTCWSYNNNLEWCGGFDDEDFSSGLMCCACRGLVPTPSPPAVVKTNCGDTDGGKVDPYGTTCFDYNPNPAWCGNYDDGDFSSEAMCCVCGGGVEITASPTPAPDSGGDNTGGDQADTPAPAPGDDKGVGVVDGARPQHLAATCVLAAVLTFSLVFQAAA